MKTLKTNPALTTADVAALLRLGDPRFVLPFNPLAGTLPVVPGNHPLPDPALALRR